jgi:integrase
LRRRWRRGGGPIRIQRRERPVPVAWRSSEDRPERLGHASIAITLDIYSHAIPAMQEDAAENIAALLER